MAVNKVIYAGETLIDTSVVTVTADTMLQGTTALNSAGEEIEGAFTLESEITEQDILIEQIKTALQNKAVYNAQPINFTIDRKKHVALKGMTWEQYCNSKCNIHGYICDTSTVWENSNEENYLIDEVSEYSIMPSATITDGDKYAWLSIDASWSRRDANGV